VLSSSSSTSSFLSPPSPPLFNAPHQGTETTQDSNLLHSSSSDSPEASDEASSSSPLPRRHRRRTDTKSRETVLSNIISLTLGELREVKEDNRDLRRQLDRVMKREAKNKRALTWIKKKLKKQHAQSSAGVSPTQRVAHPLPLHTELTTFLPFLSKYAIPPDSFVVHSASEPFVVVRPFQLNNLGQRCPLVVFLNDACTELLGYTLNELLGQSICSVSYIPEEMKNRAGPVASQGTPHSVSRPVLMNIFVQCKSGRVVLCSCKNQYFYNQRGLAGWCVAVIQSCKELGCEELPLGWMIPSLHPTKTIGMLTTTTTTTAITAENEKKRDDTQPQCELRWTKLLGQQHSRPATPITLASTSPQPGSLSPVVAASGDDTIDLQELMSQFLQPSTTEGDAEWPWLPSDLES